MAETGSSPMFDSQKAEAFAGRLLGALNSGGFCLMASIGHRTGLFDAMRDQPPLTSGEIATRAGLNERYVREWLGAMVTAPVNVLPSFETTSVMVWTTLSPFLPVRSMVYSSMRLRATMSTSVEPGVACLVDFPLCRPHRAAQRFRTARVWSLRSACFSQCSGGERCT